MTNPLQLSTATHRIARYGVCGLAIAGLLILAPDLKAADTGPMFEDLQSSATKAKTLLNAFMGLMYLGIIVIFGYKINAEEGKTWQLAIKGFASIAILAGIHAYASSQMQSTGN